MKTTNVPQPIEDAIGLSSCLFNNFPWHKLSICECVYAFRQLNKIIFQAIISQIQKTNIGEVSFFLLTILQQVSLILDRAHLDLHLLRPRVLSVHREILCLDNRLFDYSLFSKLL